MFFCKQTPSFKGEIQHFSGAGAEGRRHLLASRAAGGIKGRHGAEEEPFAGAPHDSRWENHVPGTLQSSK